MKLLLVLAFLAGLVGGYVTANPEPQAAPAAATPDLRPCGVELDEVLYVTTALATGRSAQQDALVARGEREWIDGPEAEEHLAAIQFLDRSLALVAQLLNACIGPAGAS